MDPLLGCGMTCSTCLKTFSTKDNLRYHMFTHDPDAKVKCERTLQGHIYTAHNTMERPRFPCGFPGCGKTYLNPETVSKHVKTEHTENPTRFPCILCGKEFRTRRDLESHISTHTTEKAYTCSTCGRSFAQQTGMKVHEATHLEKSTRRIVKCGLCVRIFLSKSNLLTHVKALHENLKNHPCPSCDKRFLTPTNMRTHQEAKHPTNKEKNYSCDKCEYRSHSKGNLANHARRHNPANRRECYFCQKQFGYFSSLVTHCRRHTLEDPRQTTRNQERNKILEFFVISFVKYIILILPVLIPGLIFLNLDPMRIPIHLIGFSPKNRVSNVITIFLRTGTLASLWVELLKSVACILTLMLIVLGECTPAMRQLIRVQGTKGICIIRFYRQVQIWNEYGNEVLFYFVVPPLIFFGLGIFILANYGTIRLHDVLPFSVYFILPLENLVGGAFILIVLPAAGNVYETGKDFMRFLGGRCVSRYERKLFRSLRRTGIQCGAFHMLDKERVTVNKIMVDFTIHVLLSF
ncbi:hypothetical protein Fcan01_18015 [Folsomia candida]|uniref:C2H2-type domain-containing protein n=1 Tax=Folsomia candida TaxID=158441 RepID=A0A226DPD3_FOLCA|nr:hypothetical protein Fcan01_18015 [Folsomia candida]